VPCDCVGASEGVPGAEDMCWGDIGTEEDENTER
jgi:hypothetical protein